MQQVDVAIVGGGIVGLAAALSLSRTRSVVVLEKEAGVGAHQTGHNSGVVHSGLYYAPGSLKARTCTAGRLALERFCERRGVPIERCGKIVVAVRPDEVPRLDELERRGRANGLTGMERAGPERLREREPHVAGVAGLVVPETGIVDYGEVARAYRAELEERGVEVRTGAAFVARRRRVIETTRGEVEARVLVGCAGLHSDRIARACGVEPGVRIVPFRGEYYDLRRTSLVKDLIYPVPDPSFPFLGVHFTRRVGGGVEAGPNAVLALAREGYTKTSLSPLDAWDTLTYEGFWRLAAKYWRTGAGEVWRSLSKRAFVRALSALVPEITEDDLVPGGAGVRAQALGMDGRLVDDFHIVEAEGMVHVLNAPSPAATASLAIGEAIAAKVEAQLA